MPFINHPVVTRFAKCLSLWIACLAVLSTLLGCSREEPPREVIRPVRSVEVVARGGSREREFTGTSRAGQETNLSFRVAGRVERLEVKVGDAVEAGQLIAQVEPRDFEIALGQAEANLAQTEAGSRDAAADLERIRDLYESENASKNDLDAALARSQSTRAFVDSAAQALEGARRKLSYTRLMAPVQGSIAAVHIEVNENVSQGLTVVRMTSGTRPEVEVAIPGVLIAQILEGSSVEVTFDAIPGETFEAVVTEVGVAATGTATTFPVVVLLSRDEPDVRSGMAAAVAFLFEADDDQPRIFLPTHAVGEDRDGRYVFVVEPMDHGLAHVRRRGVEIGELTADGLEIVSGLEEMERVVTAGVTRVVDGQKVRLLGAE